ncbi:MAG: MarR family transcriptional regulator [Spirochaetes bacterium]|nr:MarR family transcriptional regulator [Spirochaetota bacterium]
MNSEDFAPVIIGKLLNIGGMLQRSGNQLLLPFNLNQQQFSILFSIEKAGKVQQKSMVNQLMLEKAHVSKIVKKLSEMGLIEIKADSEDKRSSWLSTTPEGSKIMKQCQKIITEWNKRWINGIDKNQLKSIADDLTLLQSVFKNGIEK